MYTYIVYRILSLGERTHADITERLKVLAEFQGVQEHRQFMKDISKEKELKSRIKDLQRLVHSSIHSRAVLIP